MFFFFFQLVVDDENKIPFAFPPPPLCFEKNKVSLLSEMPAIVMVTQSLHT
jgi:hypothetical protein